MRRRSSRRPFSRSCRSAPCTAPRCSRSARWARRPSAGYRRHRPLRRPRLLRGLRSHLLRRHSVTHRHPHYPEASLRCRPACLRPKRPHCRATACRRPRRSTEPWCRLDRATGSCRLSHPRDAARVGPNTASGREGRILRAATPVPGTSRGQHQCGARTQEADPSEHDSLPPGNQLVANEMSQTGQPT